MNTKQSTQPVRSDFEPMEPPVKACFELDTRFVEEALRLGHVVAQNGLYRVEKFDDRVRWLTAEDSNIEVEAGCFCVTTDELWFVAFLKHSNIEIRTEALSLAGLASMFELRAPAPVQSVG